VRSDNAAPLRTSVGQPDPDAGGNGAFERTDPLRPDDRVRGAGTRDGDDQGNVLDSRAVDGDEDDVANDCGAFDWWNNELVKRKGEGKKNKGLLLAHLQRHMSKAESTSDESDSRLC